MIGDVRGFYTALGVALPESAGANVALRCFANPAGHRREDRNPSCSVNLETGVYLCHGCGSKGGPYDAAVALGRQPRAAMELLRAHELDADDDRRHDHVRRKAERRPRSTRRERGGPSFATTAADVAGYCAQLCARGDLTARLCELRGWTPDAIVALGLGFDGERITFPVHDADGRLVGLLRWAPNPDNRNGLPKTLAAAGSTRELFPPPESLGDGPIWIVEGEPDAVAARSLGLLAVAVPGASAWRTEWAERFAGRDLNICCDCDEQGRRLVSEIVADVAHLAASVKVLDLATFAGDLDGGGYDLGDLLREAARTGDAGRAALARVLLSAASATEPVQTPVGQAASATSDLLDQVRQLVARYVVLSGDPAAAAVALFVLHTWAFDAAHATPYLVVVSPEKQTGKSRLLDVLALVVRNPWKTVSTTEAALFRKIERDTPVLLLDEIDAIFGSNSERTEPLRAVLNAGNRPGASATRVVGQGANMDARDFGVFCPKVLAGIDTGRLPDTIRDRAITLRMKRRHGGEHVERLRERFAAGETEALRAALREWAAGFTDMLRTADPDLPDALSDRAADAWEPLFAIADLAGGDWPATARAAAVELSGKGDGDEASNGTLLLGAIRDVIGHRDVIATSELLSAINADDELPFGAWRDGKGLDARTLARMLKLYGVKPITIRIGRDTPKGYRAEDLRDAWVRYLPRQNPPQAQQPPQPHDPDDTSGYEHQDVADVADVADAADRGVR